MSYLSKSQRYTLLKLKTSFTSIEDVQQRILTRDHDEPLTVKNIPSDANQDELTFKYEWNNASDPSQIKFENANQEFKYLKVTASCEFSTRRVFDPTDGKNLLPKSERLNIALIEVLFVEISNEIHVVIFSNEFYGLRRVKILIGENSIEPLTATHNIHSDLFHWLFFKYIKEDYELDGNISIDNINGFTGMVINQDHMFEGNSSQTAELIITKAFITNGHPITSIKVDLQISDASINFYLSEISEGKELGIVVEKRSSITSIMNNEEIEYVVPMYIFFYLIPTVLSLYKADEREFLSTVKTDFSKEIGIEVIKTIMAKNNIIVNELG